MQEPEPPHGSGSPPGEAYTLPSPERAARLIDLAALGMALVVGALVAATLSSVRYVDDPDEVYYLAYARCIAQYGLAGFRPLFHEYAVDDAHWLYPNPLRIGFIALGAGWTVLRGSDFHALSELSLVCHVLLILASYGFLRPRLGPARALLAALLIGCSPLLMGLARRALIDSAATLAGLLVLWSFFAALRSPQSRCGRCRFAVVFGIGILVKETTLLLAAPCVVVVAYEGWTARHRVGWGSWMVALVAPVAACGVVWLIAAGDAATLAQVFRIIADSPARNLYAMQQGGGGWYRYAIDFLLLAPWPTVIGLAALGWAALRLRAPTDVIVRLGMVIAAQVAAYAPFTKNVRYVALCDVLLRALAAAFVCELVASDERPRRMAFAAVVVLALCAGDWVSFHRLFVDGALYDPMTAPLVALRGMLPAASPTSTVRGVGSR